MQDSYVYMQHNCVCMQNILNKINIILNLKN